MPSELPAHSTYLGKQRCGDPGLHHRDEDGSGNRQPETGRVVRTVAVMPVASPSASREALFTASVLAGPIVAKAEAGTYRAKPVRVFGFEEIVDAHRVMESGQAGGKMVVAVARK